MKEQRAVLIGVCRPIPNVLSFVTPIFRDGTGVVVAQEVKDGRIERFKQVELGEEFVTLRSRAGVKVGDPALYAMEFEDCISVGPAMSEVAAVAAEIEDWSEANAVRAVFERIRNFKSERFITFRRSASSGEQFDGACEEESALDARTGTDAENDPKFRATSTTEKGNSFRRSVRELLELCPQLTRVQSEVQIGHQDVDIYYEENTSTGVMRVACECKGYTRPLTRTDLDRIWKKYWPLVDGQQRLIDAIRVFAPLPLGAKALGYVKQSSMNFSTSEELELNIIDFRAYLLSIESQYRRSLGTVYVRPTLEEGLDAEIAIKQWMGGTSDQPIAILAGYGMGKTSLALHLSAQLAAARLRGEGSRIPILIHLSEISSQQSIDGLLGKLFSAQNKIPNYYYGLFAELNRRGRFIIFLDGFDEMKHAMSVPDLKYNFAELHSLVTPGSRVVLLGRPAAFISESEEHHVLRGVQRIDGREIELPGAPEYRTLRLSQFTEAQAFAFIERYLVQNGPDLKAIRGQSYDHLAALNRLEQVREHDELRALVQRPVQARMVAELVIDGRVKWRSFNRYQLYSIFVRRIIEREMGKHVRRMLSFDVRIAFHQRLAWWLWTKAGAQSFGVSDLPLHVLGELPEELGIDRDGFARELLAGSLLDKKIGDRYHFPHRSFLEFLVARRILTEEWTSRTLEEFVVTPLTPEIVDFIREAGEAKAVASWREHLDAIQVPVSSTFLTLVGTEFNATNGASFDDRVPSDASPRRVCFEFLRRVNALNSSERFNFLIRSLAAVSDEESRIMALVLMVQEAETSGSLRIAQLGQVTAHVLSGCVGGFSKALRANRYRRGRKGPGELIASSIENPYVRAFMDGYDILSKDELQLSLDPGVLFDSLQSSLNRKWVVDDLARPLSQAVLIKFAELRGNNVFGLGNEEALIVRFLNEHSVA